MLVASERRADAERNKRERFQAVVRELATAKEQEATARAEADAAAEKLDETITIEVADEKPPRKTKIASAVLPSASGRERTKRSGFAPSGSQRRPAAAMGRTDRHITSR